MPAYQRAPRQPLLWAALAFASGLTVGQYAWRPPVWWIVAAALYFMSGLWLLRRRVFWAYLLGLAAIFMVGRTHCTNTQRDASCLGYPAAEQMDKKF